MPMTAAICSQCGSQIEVNDTTEKGICPSCGTPFVKDDIVYNYNTTVKNEYQISGTNITIGLDNSSQVKLDKAEIFLTKLQNYRKAEKAFLKITEEDPDCAEAWWGYVRAVSKEFKEYAYDLDDDGEFSDFEQMAEAFHNAITIVQNVELKKKYIKKWHSYMNYIIDSCNEYAGENSREIKENKKQCKDTEALINRLEAEIVELNQKLEKYSQHEIYLEKKREKYQSKRMFSFVEMVLFGVLGFLGFIISIVLMLVVVPEGNFWSAISALFILAVIVFIFVYILLLVYDMVFVVFEKKNEKTFLMVKTMQEKTLNQLEDEQKLLEESQERIELLENEIEESKLAIRWANLLIEAVGFERDFNL